MRHKKIIKDPILVFIVVHVTSFLYRIEYETNYYM